MKNDNEQKTSMKICPRCGREFPCSAGTGKCWCFSEVFPAEVTMKIAQEFPGKCLCKDCIKELSGKNL